LFNYIGANDDCYRFPNIEKFGFGVANGTGANSANKYLVAGYSSHGFYASSVSNVWTRYNTSRFGVYVYTLPGSAIAADTTLAITASKVFVPLDATYGELIPSLSGIGAYAFNGLVGDMLRITYQKDVTGGIQWIYMYYSLPTFGYLGMQSTTIYNP
jgi:hypothetical protein